MFYQLVILALAVSASQAYDCSRVKCEEFGGDINVSQAGLQECRFKMRTDERRPGDKFRHGLQIHGYEDETIEDSEFYKTTQDCPRVKGNRGKGKLIMTESPKPSELDSLAGNADYRNCCAKKVIEYCYVKVEAVFDCGLWSPDADHLDNDRVDDIHIRTEVTYKNRKANKTVTVKFFPREGRVRCTNDFDKDLRQVLYKGKGKKRTKNCGDKDIDVRIQRFRARYADGHEYTILKAHRYQCNSQYVAMFTDPSGREKTTMRTDIDRRNDIDGAQIGPVLAQTSRGACKKIIIKITVRILWFKFTVEIEIGNGIGKKK